MIGLKLWEEIIGPLLSPSIGPSRSLVILSQLPDHFVLTSMAIPPSSPITLHILSLASVVRYLALVICWNNWLWTSGITNLQVSGSLASHMGSLIILVCLIAFLSSTIYDHCFNLGKRSHIMPISYPIERQEYNHLETSI